MTTTLGLGEDTLDFQELMQKRVFETAIEMKNVHSNVKLVVDRLILQFSTHTQIHETSETKQKKELFGFLEQARASISFLLRQEEAAMESLGSVLGIASINSQDRLENSSKQTDIHPPRSLKGEAIPNTSDDFKGERSEGPSLSLSRLATIDEEVQRSKAREPVSENVAHRTNVPVDRNGTHSINMGCNAPGEAVEDRTYSDSKNTRNEGQVEVMSCHDEEALNVLHLLLHRKLQRNSVDAQHIVSDIAKVKIELQHLRRSKSSCRTPTNGGLSPPSHTPYSQTPEEDKTLVEASNGQTLDKLHTKIMEGHRSKSLHSPSTECLRSPKELLHMISLRKSRVHSSELGDSKDVTRGDNGVNIDFKHSDSFLKRQEGEGVDEEQSLKKKNAIGSRHYTSPPTTQQKIEKVISPSGQPMTSPAVQGIRKKLFSFGQLNM